GEQEDHATVRLYVEVWAIAVADEDVAHVVRDFYAQYVSHVVRAVAGAQPHLNASDLDATAQTIVSLLEGSAVLRSRIAGRKSEASDRMLVKTLQCLIHGA
ncbi:TetR family transcriptional regulator C-terminal domain-containing protein, partial [Agreia sp.]|uniref:TetR family transcriptional regulator C-terminal domain-containing protein n=1 Tax=Agreia sp. TaxID=1872416 RepID=UPI0035BBAB7E